MGPTEQDAVRAVSALLWPLNPISRKVARALVVAARVLDADRAAWYPYAGRVADVHIGLLRQLAELGPTPNPLDRLRAERLCRAVERNEPISDLEMRAQMSAFDYTNRED